jgi:cholesterol transport system auxiliary component
MMKNDYLRMFMKAGIVFIVLVLAVGCFQRTKTPYVVEHFTFDYSSPSVSGLTPTDGLIRIERFSVAHSFDSMAMVFKPQAYRFDSYSGSRWRVNPGDMTGDFLIRDLRKAALFKQVFSYHSDEAVRFILEGAVEEFYESDEGTASNAIFVINVTLLDMREKEMTRKLRFHKTYRYAGAIDAKSPEGFAKGMSANMALFSEQLIKDLNSALK